MGEGFKRYKRLYLIDSIVKALVVCISASLLVVATFLIVIDKGVIDFQMLYASFIGVGSGLLLGLVTFLLSFKGDKRLARHLDGKLGLNEKVQTMYAFRNDEGGLKEIQRKKTRLILDNTPPKLSSFAKVWVIFFIALALTVSYFVVSLVMYVQQDPTVDNGGNPSQDETDKPSDKPGDKPSDKPSDEEFEPTDHHRKELEQLIKYVNDSLLNDVAKAEIVSELKTLLEQLDTFGTDAAMKEYVLEVIKKVRDSVNNVNSTYAFYQSAKELDNETLGKLSAALYIKDLNIIEKLISEFYKTLLFVDGGDSPRPKDELELIKGEIEALKEAMTSVLENSGLTEDDKLFVITTELVTTFNTILEKSKSVANVIGRLDPVWNNTFIEGLRQIVPPEKINEEVKTYTVSELARIFGVDLSSVGGEGDAGIGDYLEPDSQPPESGEGGSYGDGGKNFPSNDKVIDPESEEIDINKIQVEYGDIISRYMTEIKNKIEKGEFSEELALILNEYFKMLTTPKQ